MAKFQRLSNEQLDQMNQLGFVHVTGLKAIDFKVGARREIMIQALAGQTSTLCCNVDKVVMVTEDGQVWLAHYNENTYNDMCGLVHQLGIRTGHAFVPCTNGESIPTGDLLRRIAEPYEDSDMTVDRVFGPLTTTSKGKLPNLPPDSLTIANGQVQTVEEWTLWNLQPFITIDIRRLPDGQFRSSIGSPEHGGRTREGTIEKVTEILHPNFAAWYKYVFSLTGLIPNLEVQALRQYELRFVQPAKVA